MEVIEYVEKIDNIMSSINKYYKYIYDDIHNYLNDGKITYNELIDFEISLEDLSIQLKSLVFLFKDKHYQCINNDNDNNDNNNNDNDNDTNINSYEDTNKNSDKIKQYNKEVKKENKKKIDNKIDNKIDYITNKTIFNVIPLLFLYFMIIDKDSILYLKDFGVNINDTYTNIEINTKQKEYNKCKNIINNIFNEEYILNDLD